MDTHAETTRFLTVHETAQLLRVDRGTVYRAIADGRLPHLQLGPRGAIRIDAAQLEASEETRAKR